MYLLALYRRKVPSLAYSSGEIPAYGGRTFRAGTRMPIAGPSIPIITCGSEPLHRRGDKQKGDDTNDR